MEATEAMRTLSVMMKSFQALSEAEKVLKVLSSAEKMKKDLEDEINFLDSKANELAEKNKHFEELIVSQEDAIKAKKDILAKLSIEYNATKEAIQNKLEKEEKELRTVMLKKLEGQQVLIDAKNKELKDLDTSKLVLSNDIDKLKEKAKSTRETLLKMAQG